MVLHWVGILDMPFPDAVDAWPPCTRLTYIWDNYESFIQKRLCLDVTSFIVIRHSVKPFLDILGSYRATSFWEHSGLSCCCRTAPWDITGHTWGGLLPWWPLGSIHFIKTILRQAYLGGHLAFSKTNRKSERCLVGAVTILQVVLNITAKDSGQNIHIYGEMY